MSTATIVGSGPNGLAAAVHLARQGVDVTVLEAADTIGGGTRSGELTVPGLIHDHCSAIHPMGAASPFLQTLGLERHGLRWLHPEIDCAHPLDSGDAGLLYTSVARTVEGLGEDGRVWHALFNDLARDFDILAGELMGPFLHLPRRPDKLALFGPRALAPATVLARLFRTERGRALFGGLAAHVFSRLDRPASSAVGLMIGASGHKYGWVVAEGGSQAIADSLAAVLAEHGGRIHTGVRVSSSSDIPPSDLVLLDTSPATALRVFGSRLPSRIASSFRRFSAGPAAYKVDYAVTGGVPWRNPDCGRAGTVHLGGGFDEIHQAEKACALGRMPERPFVLVGQQYVADPGRAAGDTVPLYAYAHVPADYPGRAEEAVTAQIERFAPGFRDRVVATHVTPPWRLEAENENQRGGDIVGGSNAGLQVVFRPRISADPYSLGIPGVYLCSASTPPGAGAHGMPGYNAAQAALKYLGTETGAPSVMSAERDENRA